MDSIDHMAVAYTFISVFTTSGSVKNKETQKRKYINTTKAKAE